LRNHAALQTITQQSRNFATQQSRNLATQQSRNFATQQSRKASIWAKQFNYIINKTFSKYHISFPYLPPSLSLYSMMDDGRSHGPIKQIFLIFSKDFKNL
jgi:hypothetical protein